MESSRTKGWKPIYYYHEVFQSIKEECLIRYPECSDEIHKVDYHRDLHEKLQAIAPDWIEQEIKNYFMDSAEVDLCVSNKNVDNFNII